MNIKFFSGLAQDASITFISPPQTKNPGENVTLECSAVKPSDVFVQWLKDGRSLTLGTLRAFPDNRLSIVVDDATNTYKMTVS